MTGRGPRVSKFSPVSNGTEGGDGASPKSPLLFRAAKYTAVGFEFPSTVLAGLVLGYFADQYLDTSPWMVLVLGLLGLVLAFYRLVLLLRHFSAERK